LQKEWDGFRTSVLSRRQERIQALSQEHAALEHQRQARTVRLKQLHERIDETIDDLNAKFADSAVALQYDANRLLDKFHTPENFTQETKDSINKDSKPLPCLGQRAHWMDCQKKYSSDSRPCNAYFEELEKCVLGTISQAIE
jgi:predicted transcriptional regulator